MRAISVWQPWGSLWLTDKKWHETRHWAADYRGPLAVHATKKILLQFGGEFAGFLVEEFGPNWATELPLGAVIGQVDLIDCIEIEDSAKVAAHAQDLACGNWTPGRFAWRRGPKATVFKQPFPFRGQQGFFHVPDNIMAQATAAEEVA